eukprot:jgi/Ulvmu1/4859/UM020_0145.1
MVAVLRYDPVSGSRRATVHAVSSAEACACAAFARLRANASAVEFGRAVALCLAPQALAAASEEEFGRVCQHVGTALKLLSAPLPVNEENAVEGVVHVPGRVVAKAERMRRVTAEQLLQTVIDHPRIADVLGLPKPALEELLRAMRQVE